MDPASMIVMALATGAAASVQAAVQDSISIAYTGLKDLLQRKFGRTEEVALLEAKPDAKSRQTVVQEMVQEVAADKDEEVLRQAQLLLDAIRQHAPQAAQIVGVSLEDVEAGASLNIKDILSSGSGVIAKRVKAGQDINVEGIRAGEHGEAQERTAHPPQRQ
jgi:hypothetical protein